MSVIEDMYLLSLDMQNFIEYEIDTKDDDDEKYFIYKWLKKYKDCILEEINNSDIQNFDFSVIKFEIKKQKFDVSDYISLEYKFNMNFCSEFECSSVMKQKFLEWFQPITCHCSYSV
jgi:hypothetical protein